MLIAWSNGATTEDLTGLGAGTYELTVTDANGCEVSIDGGVEITEPNILEIAIDATADASCNGATDGSIDITVSGGTAPYSYAWSNGATTEDLAGLGAGTYELTITDANGCEAKIDGGVEITEPNILEIAIDATADASCNGAADGSIDVTISGGTAPYTYAWSNGAATEDLSGLGAGTYELTVTDANGCEVSIDGGVEITEPEYVQP